MNGEDETLASHTGRVIILTGTPGTGKTTISKEIARRIQGRYVSLTNLVADKGLWRGFDRKRRSRIVDMAKVRASIGSLVGHLKCCVVVDTHIPEIAPKRFVRKVVVLRCHPSVLAVRLRRKGWRKDKIKENLLAELLGSCSMAATQFYRRPTVTEIDTSHADVETSAGRVLKILFSPQPREPKQLDWLGELKVNDILPLLRATVK